MSADAKEGAWSVTVELDGKQVVTLGHNHLSGDQSPNEEAIRTAAHHLLAFIGDPHPEPRTLRTSDIKAIDPGTGEPSPNPAPEPGLREKVLDLLWRYRWRGSPWADKMHLMRLYPEFIDHADNIIGAVELHLRDIHEFTPRAQPTDASPSLTTHTPTPWDWGHNKTDPKWPADRPIFSPSDNRHICAVRWHDNEGERVLADAAFIVKACNSYEPNQKLIADMLAALEFYANELNYHPNGAPMTPYIDGKPDPTKQEKDRGLIARTAIARAEGA